MIEWRFIPGFDSRYSVSSTGRVFSNIKHRLMKFNMHRAGYRSVMLNTGQPYHFKRINVHRLVALAFFGPQPDRFEVDHINRVKSDNRAVNLRYVARGVNMHNRVKQKLTGARRSRFKGVARLGCISTPWLAQICINHRHIRIGQFRSEVAAARAYDAAALRLRGKCAATNKSLGYFS